MTADMYTDRPGPPGAAGGRFAIKRIAMLAGGVAALLGAVGGGLQVSGLLSRRVAEDAPAATAAVGRPAPLVFFDLPDQLVNLRSDAPRPAYLKIAVSLELERETDRQTIVRVLPRVVDTFQVYLRELHVDQLQGSAGLLRLREELLLRINAATKPVQVRDVLFKEMLVQ